MRSLSWLTDDVAIRLYEVTVKEGHWLQKLASVIKTIGKLWFLLIVTHD